MAFNYVNWTYFKDYIRIVVVGEDEPVRLVGIEGDEAFVLIQAGIGALLVAREIRLHPRRNLVGIPCPDVKSSGLEGDEVGVLDRDVFLDARVDGAVLLAEAVGAVLREAPVLGHVAALVGGHELPRLVPDDIIQPQGGVLAAGGCRVLRLQVEGFRPFLVEGGHRVEGGGVREHPRLSIGIETDHRVLLVRLLHEAQRTAVLGEGELVDTPQGVQAAVGKAIDRDRRALVLVGLLHERGVDGREGELLRGMQAHLEGLDVRELTDDGPGGQVDDRERVLGQFVPGEFLDLRPAGLLEFGLDQAHGVAVVVREPDLVPPLDFQGAGALLAGDADEERAVAFLRIDRVGNDFPGRGEDGSADGLPTVIDVVVEGFLLGCQRERQGEKDGEERDSFHIRVVV